MKTKLWPAFGLCLIIAASCARRTPLPPLPPFSLQDVPVDSVESVVFWIGDAGAAAWGVNPILNKLAADVDYWSRAVHRDSAVSIVYLGDNVYPAGVRDAGLPEFWPDSTHL